MVRVEKVYDYDIFDSSIKSIFDETTIVLDIGGGSGFQGNLIEYKRVLSKQEYYSLDIDRLTHPDILGDAMNLPIRDECVGAILCVALLEHVPNPFEVVSEMYRILKRHGKIFVYVPFMYPFHASPKDFFRFSEDALIYLFKNFERIKIQPAQGGYVNTVLRFMAAFTSAQRLMLLLERPMNHLFILAFRFFAKIKGFEVDKMFQNLMKSVTGYNLFAEK